MTYLFPILLAAIGLYVLYSAIVGRGRLFALENIKEEEQDKVRKLLRLLYFGLAAIMLLMSVFNFGQTVLYTKQVTYYEVTPAYTADFSDIIKDGMVEYDSVKYPVEGQHDVNEMNAILMAANTAHPDKFTDNSASSMFSCFGSAGSNKIANYYKVIEVTDANGNKVYESTIKSVRSDANDGSFISKLYQTFSDTLLRVLSYVFLGLAIVGLVAVFLIIRKFTDKEKLAKAKAQAAGQVMPSSAFNFDEEEKNE